MCPVPGPKPEGPAKRHVLIFGLDLALQEENGVLEGHGLGDDQLAAGANDVVFGGELATELGQFR